MHDPRERHRPGGFPWHLVGFVASVALGLLVAAVVHGFSHAPAHGTVPYSDLIRAVREGRVTAVEIAGRELNATLDNGERLRSLAAADASLMPRLLEANVAVTVAEPDDDLTTALLILLPVLALMGLAGFLVMRRQSRPLAARSRRPSPRPIASGLDEVAGIDEVRDELGELVDYLREPERFQRIGARIPKGVLLAGAPGVGKTLLARAIAGDAGVPFFAASGAEFVEMFVGVGARRVRDLFEQARKVAPAIVFIDEIDAIGRRRSALGTGSNDEREQTLNQILVEMDGFADARGVIVLAATNRPDILDPALLRPGRFDRRVDVPLPDLSGRLRILELHARRVRLDVDVDLAVVARGTQGLAGADLANLVNEAALAAARRRRIAIEACDLQAALDRTLMGLARRSMVLSAEERHLTACHEAGHALTAALLPHGDPIHKVTIVPHGPALGMVVRLPLAERLSISRRRLDADLVVTMAGRAAEAIVFGEAAVTAGAAADIERATGLARRMVAEWGMDEEIGLVRAVELDPRTGEPAPLGDETRRAIDRRVRDRIAEAYQEAKAMLLERRELLDRLTEALLERETLAGEEVMAMVAGAPAAA